MVGHGGDSVTRRAREPLRPAAQPAPCMHSPRRALTHSGDLREEQEKIISGVERQIQGKGLEELNQARVSKGEC